MYVYLYLTSASIRFLAYPIPLEHETLHSLLSIHFVRQRPIRLDSDDLHYDVTKTDNTDFERKLLRTLRAHSFDFSLADRDKLLQDVYGQVHEYMEDDYTSSTVAHAERCGRRASFEQSMISLPSRPLQTSMHGPRELDKAHLVTLSR